MLLQQTLDISITNQRTFQNFICTTNQDQKDMLAFYINSPSKHMMMLTGDPGSGKSHLLHAACHLFQQNGGHASLVSLRSHQDIATLLGRTLSSNELICIDDVQLACAHPDLEHMLFRLYNQAELEQCKLIWSMRKHIGFIRKDLISRQQSMLSVTLLPYTPSEIGQIVQQHLQITQSSVSPDVCTLLIKEYSRNIPKLMSKLKEIEQHACSIQKKITLKMARELIYKDLHLLDEST